MKIKSVIPIWQKGRHSAFTDLCLFKDQLLCCFREAENHISGDGIVRVLLLDKTYTARYNQSLRVNGADLRDPKLTVTSDGKLILLAHARFKNEDNKTTLTKPYCWFSTDGFSWSSPRVMSIQNEWLWRVSFCQDFALGFSYNRRLQRLNLYKGNPLRTMDCVKPNALSKQKHGLGYPNESDIIFTDEADAYALVRRDADTGSAQLGYAKPPYTQWKWQDLKHYIGGPAMVKLNNEHAIAGGRIWTNSGPKMALYTLDLNRAKLTPVLALPSKGDSSYPGLVIKDGLLVVCYYSSHIDDKSSIFIAEIDISNHLKQISN